MVHFEVAKSLEKELLQSLSLSEAEGKVISQELGACLERDHNGKDGTVARGDVDGCTGKV